MIKIGFLGPKGTFSHEALEKYTAENASNYIACEYSSFPDILQAIQNGDIQEGIVPIENSLEGAVNATMDTLAFDVDLKIKSEWVLAVKANILAKKGTELKDIKYILSHPQPLGQCRKYLSANFPSAEIISVYSTAGAAQEVVEGQGDRAAIGSLAAAEVYGLEILARDIQDNNNNFTRFVVISKEDTTRTGNDKTSIVFSTEDKPGSLYKILDIFSLWDINMSRIESRPAKNQLGRYIFFIDISGHKDDQDLKDALTMVKRKSSFYKFLGSYPVYAPDRG
ncbi:MAG: prephenate dehydratase [Clostridia bacterium]|nr:prephenate dehydratase [Clostridia bacterium]